MPEVLTRIRSTGQGWMQRLQAGLGGSEEQTVETPSGVGLYLSNVIQPTWPIDPRTGVAPPQATPPYGVPCGFPMPTEAVSLTIATGGTGLLVLPAPTRAHGHWWASVAVWADGLADATWPVLRGAMALWPPARAYDGNQIQPSSWVLPIAIGGSPVWIPHGPIECAVSNLTTADITGTMMGVYWGEDDTDVGE